VNVVGENLRRALRVLVVVMSLEEVPTDALMAEIARRLECQTKPEKRLILIGPPGCGKVRRCRPLSPSESPTRHRRVRAPVSVD
jgi:hypothetical protein